jgi:hypothetical protein
VNAVAAPAEPGRSAKALHLCLWCLAAVVVEVALYASYRGHDARFHWFTHLFVGGSTVLVVMSLVASRMRRPVPLPLVWLLLGHLVAMVPDFLFSAVAHQRWMDVFLGHLSAHFVPGQNATWYVVSLLCLGLYLAVLDRLRNGAAR